MRIKITGSKAHRVWKCPASAVLPQVEQSEPSPLAGRGTHTHEYLERVGGGMSIEDALALAPAELRPAFALIDHATLPRSCACEVAFAWDWRTRKGRELGRGINRDYDRFELAPTETAMTLDLVGVEVVGGIRRGLVGDYKTGHTRYPAPDRFGQLLLGALAARDVYKLDEVVVDLYYIDLEDGENFRARRTLDEWDLDTFADEWSEAMWRVDHWQASLADGDTPNVVEGSHCQYCPAMKACPAKLALVSRLPVEIDGITRTGLPMTLERAADAYVQIERFEEALKGLKAEILELAKSQPIQLADGRMLEFVASERRALRADVAFGILKERYGEQVARDACKFTMSIEAVKNAASANLKPKQRLSTRDGTGVLDSLLREIGQAGGLEVKQSGYVKAHVRKK